ncbi:MAG: prenyltransferase [Bacteroidales bacterium]|nr:prenyltransferase [Bacteroidales bacterium]MCM1146415.1 prenyltransferase [Bacteroidales bacterium]MCM1205147.1 prenyltransferase [Bacillota bacterium]MCM1509394.1 prenyltransferase [Clostridium sp.]
MEKKHSLREWLIAVRPWSFPASAMPVMVTLAYLYWTGTELNMLNGVWALANIIIFHAAGNTWSDYFDYRKGVDAQDTYGSRTMTDGMFLPAEIKRLAVGLLAVAVAGGLMLAFRTGWPLVWIGLGGFACTVFYPVLKYNALGDVCIFFAYALLPMLGTAYVAAGAIDLTAMWTAVPVGLITVAILHANNSRDVTTDKRAHIHTLAMLVGNRTSIVLYWAEVLLPFVWVAFCAATGLFPLWTLLVLPALIPASANVRMMAGLTGKGGEAVAGLDEATAKLQLVFGLLFTVSFLIAVWTR